MATSNDQGISTTLTDVIVGTEGCLQVRVVGEVLNLIEIVEHSSLGSTVLQIVLLAGCGIWTERLDQIAIRGYILQPIRGRIGFARSR